MAPKCETDLHFWLMFWFSVRPILLVHARFPQCQLPRSIPLSNVLHCNFEFMWCRFEFGSFFFLSFSNSASVTVCNCFSAILKIIVEKCELFAHFCTFCLIFHLCCCFCGCFSLHFCMMVFPLTRYVTLWLSAYTLMLFFCESATKKCLRHLHSSSDCEISLKRHHCMFAH